jgi:hypothetical protein
MTDFLNSLKADLLDRRLLPILAVVVVALAGAVAYAALGGGSSSSSPTAVAPSAPTQAGTGGLAVSQVQNSTSQAVAETTNGASVQRHGTAHDPFAQLPGAKSASAASTGSSASGSAGKSASGSTGSGGSTTGGSKTGSAGGEGGKTTPSSQPKPSTPAKPETIYTVAIRFGVVPEGVPAESAALTAYEKLSARTPLPSIKEKLIEFLGVTVTGTGTSASFAIDAEVFPRGSASCLPGPVQCKVIDLKAGKTEQFNGTLPDGQPVTYELRVTSITTSEASGARLGSLLRSQAKAEHDLLGRGGLLTLAGIRYSSRAGVFVFAGRPAFGTRAGVARNRARHSG